jgi:hypothetical protein
MQDPVMLRVLQEHEHFRRVMDRLNAVLMGGAMTRRAKVQAVIVVTATAGAMTHPLTQDVDDQALRTELARQLRKLFA